MAQKPALATKPAPPKPEAKPTAHGQRGFGAFVGRGLTRLFGERPDHSKEGFVSAIRAGIQFVSRKDWNTADDMLEELEHQIRETLRVPQGIYCDYVARDRETKQPRILVLSDWGLREAVEGQITFTLHYKPERAEMGGRRG